MNKEGKRERKMGTAVTARAILQGGESPFTAQTGHAGGGGHKPRRFKACCSWGAR